MEKEKIQLNDRGFSLLETIAAVSILMLTIVGPLALAAKGITFANYVKDEITGFYLAQEAMEAIRNIRDTNIKNNGNWLDIIRDKCMDTNAPCRLDIWHYNDADHGVKRCVEVGLQPAECERMKVVDLPDINYKSGAGPNLIRLYGYVIPPAIIGSNIPTDSIFTRKITIKNVTADYLAMDPSIISPAEKNILQLDDSKIDEINVTVEVDWVRGGIARSVQVSENLFSI